MALEKGLLVWRVSGWMQDCERPGTFHSFDQVGCTQRGSDGLEQTGGEGGIDDVFRSSLWLACGNRRDNGEDSEENGSEY